MMKKLMLFLALFNIVLPAYSCPDRVYSYAKEAGRKLVSHHLGGRNISVDVGSCEYKSGGGYKVYIDVYWDGSFFGNRYNSSGYAHLRNSGTFYDYDETYANGNLKDLRIVWGIIAIGTALGAAAASSD